MVARDFTPLAGEGTGAEGVRRALRLEYFTIAWNVIEALVALGAGWIAGSIALVGFGLDSIIEITSAAALV